MIKFLFWNVCGKSIAHLISAAVDEYAIDIVVLAECRLKVPSLLKALNNGRLTEFSYLDSTSKRLMLFSRLPGGSIKSTFDEDNISLWQVRPLVGPEITLATVHLSSKLYQDSDDQTLAMTRVARQISKGEAQVGHSRTVMFGDLNMNPFEAGVVGAEALHAVMDKKTALRISRTVAGERRPFFYNPMWSHLGDGSVGPPGTYYRSESKQVSYFWHTYDQVLLRPSLLAGFDDHELKVLDRIGTSSLLTRTGIPDTVSASDHLPIVFGLELSTLD